MNLELEQLEQDKDFLYWISYNEEEAKEEEEELEKILKELKEEGIDLEI